MKSPPMYKLEQAEKYANAEVVVSPVVQTGFFWVILRMRPASPKSTVSGISWDHYHHRETIAIKKGDSGDAVSGGTPSNKAMEEICMQQTAPAGEGSK